MSGRDFQIALVYNLETELKKGTPEELIALQDTANATRNVYETLLSLGYPTVLVAARESIEQFEADLSQYSPENTFVFFNCDGFDGDTWGAIRIAEVVERLGFAHTGSPAQAIALVTDKAQTKGCLFRAGVPTPAYEVFCQATGETDLHFPLIVKPAVEDASLGIQLESVVSDPDHLAERVKYVSEMYHQPALVEEFIPGREFSVALWGNGTIDMLPLYEQDYSQIANPLHCLLTYEAKWMPESSYYHNRVYCPAELPDHEKRVVREVALKAYHAVGLRDFGRMDIRLRNGVPYVIDINDLPDLGPTSGFSRNVEVAGYSYPQMVERILKLALEREGWIEPHK